VRRKEGKRYDRLRMGRGEGERDRKQDGKRERT